MDIFAATAALTAEPLPRNTTEIEAEAARITAMLADLALSHATTLASVTLAGERRDGLLLADADLAAIDAVAGEIDILAVTLERIAVAQMVLSERQDSLAALVQELEKDKELTV
jgi:hypothetical protein